jgi:hypothetical protein
MCANSLWASVSNRQHGIEKQRRWSRVTKSQNPPRVLFLACAVKVSFYLCHKRKFKKIPQEDSDSGAHFAEKRKRSSSLVVAGFTGDNLYLCTYLYPSLSSPMLSYYCQDPSLQVL